MHLLSHESEGHYCSGPTKLWEQKASQFLQQAHTETEGNPPPHFTQAIKGEPFKSRLATSHNVHLVASSCDKICLNGEKS